MLLAIDLDNTILNFHSHNDLCKNIFKIKPEHVTQEHVLALLKLHSQDSKQAFKHQDQMLELIREAHLNGHHVAIVSYTAFDKIIPTLLLELGLSQDEVNKIFIRGGLPSPAEQKVLGKKNHIEDALSHFDYNKEDHDQALLIDDSYSNYSLALSQGFKSILVPGEYQPSDKHYFQQAKMILDQEKELTEELALSLPLYIPSILPVIANDARNAHLVKTHDSSMQKLKQ
jgi:FMN phosphatase YigB (HAD superfamily)